MESQGADGNVCVGLQGRNTTSRDLWEEGKNQLCDIFYHIFNVHYTFILKPKFYYILYGQLPSYIALTSEGFVRSVLTNRKQALPCE